MVRPQELIDAILFTLQQADRLPSGTNFVGYEPDTSSESIKLPLVEVSTGPMTRDNLTNTELVGFVEDHDGQQIGRRYVSNYRLMLDVSVWTAHGSKYSARDLGNIVRDALYAHDTSGPNEPLRHPDNSTIDEVWHVNLQDASQTDDLGTSPTLRRWEQTMVVAASEEYVSRSDSPAASGFDFGGPEVDQ